MLSTVVRVFSIYSLENFFEIGTVIINILWMWKLRVVGRGNRFRTEFAWPRRQSLNLPWCVSLGRQSLMGCVPAGLSLPPSAFPLETLEGFTQPNGCPRFHWTTCLVYLVAILVFHICTFFSTHSVISSSLWTLFSWPCSPVCLSYPKAHCTW